MTRNKQKQIDEVEDFENVFGGRDQIKGKWGEEYFKNKAPIVLELACGHGQYTLEMAAKFPEKNFIGVDKKGDRIWNGSTNALEGGSSNVAFMREQIEKLGAYFEEGEVDEIWITFPDPFPKPCKHKRRLTSHRFLDVYKKILKPGGIIHLKTDNKNLFEYSLESVESFKGAELLEVIRDVHSQDPVPDLLKILTFYERKFMDKGPIFYARFLI